MKGRSFRKIAFMAASLAFSLGTGSQAASHDPPSIGKAAERRQLRLAIGDFSLTDQTGAPFGFHNLQGRVVVLAFMYTTCPDVCPLLTANMRVVQQNLEPSERAAVFLLSITTDPEIDSPKVLKSYGARHKVDFSNWSFLTGDQNSLERVWKMFGVKVERKARGLVDHTTLTAVVDQKSTMRLAYSGAAPNPKKVLDDVRDLLGRGDKESLKR